MAISFSRRQGPRRVTLVNYADSPWRNLADCFSIEEMISLLLAVLLSPHPVRAAEPPRAMDGLKVSISSWTAPEDAYEDAVLAKTGALLFVRGGRLGYRLRGSTVSAAMPVGMPGGGRRLLIDGSDLYAYGDGVFRYSREGSFETLLKTPAPVSALAVSGVMFFTTRLGLYSLRAGTADLLIEGATGRLRLEGERLILESMSDKKRFTIEGWREVLTR